MLFMRIALCVLSLTRALLQIHCGFTTILCLGSGQGGGCGIVVKIVTFICLSWEGSLPSVDSPVQEIWMSGEHLSLNGPVT